MTSLGADLVDLSRRQLYELARERDLAGRSGMSRDDLVAALSAPGSGAAPAGAAPAVGADDDEPEFGSRVEAFRLLAEARARGEMVLIPRMLTGNDRRVHVRQTIREDHRTRIRAHDDEAAAKFDKLAGSLFSFFRGTALLFYRDLAGEDAWMPTVLTAGDVHPENFGVMPSRDDVPLFGINDVDEAYYAPFTWDLKRGAVGFMIGAEVEGGQALDDQRDIVAALVEGYIDGMADYARDETESDDQVRQDNGPKMIRRLIKKALRQGRRDWLAEDYLDPHGRGFRSSKKLVPIPSRREEFQAVMDAYAADRHIDEPTRAPGLRVKDVCERKGQGTASLGLSRYYLLIEGPAADGTDDLVLEMKQARRSALAGLAPPSPYAQDGEADRVSHAQRVQLVRGDAFFGSLEHEGISFMVRERSHYRDDIDIDELSTKQWKTYARICGRVLAQAHAQSDDDGRLDHDIEPLILESMGPRELFVDDIVRYAQEAAERYRSDHEHYRRDHALGAFRSVDLVYR